VARLWLHSISRSGFLRTPKQDDGFPSAFLHVKQRDCSINRDYQVAEIKINIKHDEA